MSIVSIDEHILIQCFHSLLPLPKLKLKTAVSFTTYLYIDCLYLYLCIYIYIYIYIYIRITLIALNILMYICIYHHHHIVLAARISLTLSRHSSLSFIALCRSSGQHPVSSHSCWMYVRAGRPYFCAAVETKIFYIYIYIRSPMGVEHPWRRNCQPPLA